MGHHAARGHGMTIDLVNLVAFIAIVIVGIVLERKTRP